MIITCPYCGYSGNISEKLVPREGRNVGCPTCKRRFSVQKTDDPQIGVSFPIEGTSAGPAAEPEMVIERNAVPGFEDNSPGAEKAAPASTSYPAPSPRPAFLRDYAKVSALILVSYLSLYVLGFIVGVASAVFPVLQGLKTLLSVLDSLAYIVCFVLVIVFLNEASKAQRETGFPQKGKGCLIALLVFFIVSLVCMVIYLLFSVLISALISTIFG